MSPTQRSKKLLEDAGWFVVITEKWNPWTKIRQDLFGWMDLLAIKGDETLGVQTTTASHISARVAKIKSIPASALWLASPTRRIVVHGWAKQGPRGKRKKWTCKVIEVSPLLTRRLRLSDETTLY